MKAKPSASTQAEPRSMQLAVVNRLFDSELFAHSHRGLHCHIQWSPLYRPCHRLLVQTQPASVVVESNTMRWLHLSKFFCHISIGLGY